MQTACVLFKTNLKRGQILDISSIIRMAHEEGASDLHLTAGSLPYVRISGILKQLKNFTHLTTADIQQWLSHAANERHLNDFGENLELDFGYSLDDRIRIRCNAAIQRGLISLSLRFIPDRIPSFQELNLPEVCKDLSLISKGLFIVSGPNGSGKSTTLAAMLDFLNHTESLRIITIEDPIEFRFVNDKCEIIQRELGSDTRSFNDALKYVLRQDADVIMIGEMRDPETASAVLSVAETGHYVMTTSHAQSSEQAVERITDLFPLHERQFTLSRVASLLAGIMCQTLVPSLDGKSRVPAVEIVLPNTAIRNTIREGKIYQMHNVMSTCKEKGIQVLEQSLVELYAARLITRNTMLTYCNDKNRAEQLLYKTKRNENMHDKKKSSPDYRQEDPGRELPALTAIF
jgi:twitching motility protein PilT